MEDNIQQLLSNYDIPECKGMPPHLWTMECVSLHNDDGIAMEEGFCHSVKSDLVVGSTGPLGHTHVAVHILKSLKPDKFPDDWRYSVRAWPTTHVFYNGASFFNHERRHKFNCQGLNQDVQSRRCRQRSPTDEMHIPTPQLSRKAVAFLSQESINLVSNKVCANVIACNHFPG
jgi:hypothetical protein